MKQLILAAILSATAAIGFADEHADLFQPVTSETDLKTFAWQNRLIVVFANSKEDVRLQTQIEYLKIDPAALTEREIVVLTDSDPAMDSLLRQKFRPRGFTLLLIGKDGQVKLRKPFPWDLRALSRAIDKMPMRRQEIKAKK
ncbi:MAG: DUF4174 domain-containing protein [Paracoccaceae bacterium]